MHDFKIFKKSMRKLKFKPFFIVDKGYLGIKKLGFGCLMPSKAKKTEKLDSELKKLNTEIGRRRIQVEHVFGRMKCFKILSCVYRNRRKRLNLRFNLLAGIYNLDWVKDKQLN
ncbi:transposase family protein [Acinetobacter lwoffii]|uniref:Transposase n=22 Tax=Moraxellaceae TaxID=468 RepID=A0AAE7K056_ACILW|nr:transposase [Acinetobacter nosocomialis]MRA03943.1 transposase family protein [Acinetobacter lwoffii]QJB49912.1 transposase family protein [Acinetobacter sp. NEB149]QQT59610.1 transposase [Acinetobacter johnsonii]RSB94134.1 transposase [Acinetobacter sp. FDAARGOS_541]